MKKISLISITAITAFTAIALGSISPNLSSINIGDNAYAQSKSIQLKLTAEKQVISEKQGKRVATWQTIASNYSVIPGEILRYRITAENSSDKAMKNLVVTTQRIPNQMVYVLNSAGVLDNNKAEITYSIDNGKTFTAKPQIQVKLNNGKISYQPAPATAYTHVQWRFEQVPAKNNVVGVYQLRVK